jgi:hypothetical protein
MTTGWVFFGIVMPAVVAGGGRIMVLAHERYLRKQQERRAKPAE